MESTLLSVTGFFRCRLTVAVNLIIVFAHHRLWTCFRGCWGYWPRLLRPFVWWWQSVVRLRRKREEKSLPANVTSFWGRKSLTATASCLCLRWWRLLWRLQGGRHTIRQSVTQWSKNHNPVQKLGYVRVFFRLFSITNLVTDYERHPMKA